MNILHLSMGIGPKSFGVSRAILGFVKWQIQAGHNVQVWTFESPEGIEWACKNAGIPQDYIKSFEAVGPRSLFYSPKLETEIIGSQGREFDILHQHAIWGLFGRATKKWSEFTGRPFVVSPHGALESYYFNRGRLKKRIAGFLYANYLFKQATCFHACSDKEYTSIRKTGVNLPVAVIPNGIDTSRYSLNVSNKKDDESCKKKRMLFLSRVVPGKGLEMLFDSVSQIPEFIRNWELVIAGNGTSDYISYLQNKARTLQIDRCVSFVGFVDGEDKIRLLETADLFVLPSYSENFGIAVAEALQLGIPSIASKGAPWVDLENANCGWWVDTDVDSLSTGIRNAILKPDEELHMMGQNGKKLIEEKYSLQRVGDMSIALYEWMIGKSTKPDFVY